MPLQDILIQSIALVAVAGQALSFHAKTRRDILILQVLGISIWVIHYLLLSAWTGAAINIVNVLVTTAFLFKNEQAWIKNRYFFVLSVAVLAAATAAAWQGLFSLFALLGVSLMTLAKWQDNPRMIRSIAVFAGIFWILYDGFAGSYGGVLAESIILVSVLISLLRKKSLHV